MTALDSESGCASCQNLEWLDFYSFDVPTWLSEQRLKKYNYWALEKITNTTKNRNKNLNALKQWKWVKQRGTGLRGSVHSTLEQSQGIRHFVWFITFYSINLTRVCLMVYNSVLAAHAVIQQQQK